jgi:hypothetical protein
MSVSKKPGDELSCSSLAEVRRKSVLGALEHELFHSVFLVLLTWCVHIRKIIRSPGERTKMLEVDFTLAPGVGYGAILPSPTGYTGDSSSWRCPRSHTRRCLLKRKYVSNFEKTLEVTQLRSTWSLPSNISQNFSRTVVEDPASWVAQFWILDLSPLLTSFMRLVTPLFCKMGKANTFSHTIHFSLLKWRNSWAWQKNVDFAINFS